MSPKPWQSGVAMARISFGLTSPQVTVLAAARASVAWVWVTPLGWAVVPDV